MEYNIVDLAKRLYGENITVLSVGTDKYGDLMVNYGENNSFNINCKELVKCGNLINRTSETVLVKEVI